MTQHPRIVHYERRSRPNANYSLESIFQGLRNQLAERGVQIRAINAPCYSNGVLPRLRIALHASRNQGDVTHVTGDINFATVFLNPRRTILTIHDCSSLIRTTGIRRRLLKFFWVKLPARRVRFVTTVSEASKKHFQEMSGCSESKIVVIANSISSDFAFSAKEFNWQKPRLLQMGTAINKNIVRLSEAIQGLPCTLTVVGTLSDELVKSIRGKGIDLEQKQNLSALEVVEEYRRADLVTFPSTIEGFGMPILEGQATGRPVITSNTSSMPEVAGEGACFVDPFDVASIRQGVRRVIEDREYRDTLVRFGLENVKRFDSELIAEQYLGLYNRVAVEAESR